MWNTLKALHLIVSYTQVTKLPPFCGPGPTQGAIDIMLMYDMLMTEVC
jgi:hypothetical protein